MARSHRPEIHNIAPYYDDFSEDKNFARVLFRPGAAVQARELTQAQTITFNYFGLDRLPLAKLDHSPFGLLSIRVFKFWRINTEQPDLLLIDRDSIAIGDIGSSANYSALNLRD